MSGRFESFVALHEVPPDPRYLSFAKGLFKADEDLADQWRWRWSSLHSGWFTYSLKDWVLENVGVPDTPLPYSFRFGADEDDPSAFSVKMWLPDLFASVEAVYAANKGRWPGLVWALHGGGDWQNALGRPVGGPPGKGGTEPGGDGGLSVECMKRVADVRAWEKRGDISSAQAARMIDQIVHECTVGPAL